MSADNGLRHSGEACVEESFAGGVIPGRTIRVHPEAAKIGAPRSLSAGEPRVELIREGGAVKAIDVTCACGKKIRLHCQF